MPNFVFCVAYRFFKLSKKRFQPERNYHAGIHKTKPTSHINWRSNIPRIGSYRYYFGSYSTGAEAFYRFKGCQNGLFKSNDNSCYVRFEKENTTLGFNLQ